MFYRFLIRRQDHLWVVLSSFLGCIYPNCSYRTQRGCLPSFRHGFLSRVFFIKTHASKLLGWYRLAGVAVYK
ncbi:MAG: hypothetical protein EAZ57_05795 [Cytophagales bacterium]|nr:MAG: hypothetical protein EAZ67_06700 [Cytophagales bacterium]TAF60864.1 MAG: hypothetical protein EAZ57_05795 [Cytophagales bacterium]